MHRAPDGQEYAFGGKYLEIHPPNRMVCTSAFEMTPQYEAVETLTLEARDGGTLVTTHTRHASVQARCAHIYGGMEAGMSEGYERLDDLVRRMAAAQRRRGHDRYAVEVPPVLARALARDKPAKSRFDAMSCTHRREHIRYIMGVRREETRQRRVAKTVADLKKSSHAG